MNKTDSINRWSEQQLREINRCLASGIELPDFVAKSSDGYRDLRGVRVTEVIENRDMHQIDFTFGSFELGGMIIGSHVAQCIFERVDLQTNIGSSFNDCSFRRAKLMGARFNGTFSLCDFSSANLRGRTAVDVTFQNCSFSKSKLTGTHFVRCEFSGCSWKEVVFGAGSINKSTFRGESPADVEFGDHLYEGIRRL